MEYLRIDTSVFHSREYIGATPVQRSTWLSLLGYCAIQENGGIIDACQDWGERRWMQTCGVTLSEIEDECDLWAIDIDQNGVQFLTLAYYPMADQEKCQQLRKRAKAAGLASGEARRLKKLNQKVQPDGSTESQTSRSKERVGEERIGEGEESSSASLSIDDLRIKCYVGPDEEGAFLKLFKPFTRAQSLKVINKLSAKRIQDGQHPRPPLSHLSPYIQKHFNQIKEW